MKVFVWKAYGDISVHAFTTDEQKEKLKKSLVEVLESQGNYNVKLESSWFDIQEAIESEQYSDSDMFEYGTGFYKIKE